MAQSIGDLFITLGFNVDKQKLDDFNNSVQSVFGSILKFSAIAGTGAGLYEITKGVAETTNKWRDFNSEVGGSTNALQKFVALYSTVNPFSSLSAAQQVATHIQQYGSNAFYGGDGSAYGKFGGDPSDFINPVTGQIDTALILPKIIERLRSGRALAMATAGGNVAQVNKWITDITGSPDTINMLNATQEQQAQSEKTLDLMKQQIDETEAAAEAISQLRLNWDNFVNHAIASLAPGVNQDLKDINEKGFWRTVGDDIVGTPAYAKKMAYYFGAGVYGVGREMFLGTKDDPYGLWQDYQKLGFGAKKPANAMQFWQGQGYSHAGASAWAAQEFSESGGNPAARNFGHVGLYQWNAERAAKILAGTGIDVRTASADDQRRAAAWEAQQMGIPTGMSGLSAGAGSEYLSHHFEMHEGYNRAHGDETAYRARMAENMAGDTNNTVTINVQSNSDDNEDLSRRIHQRFIDVTYPTQKLEGY